MASEEFALGGSGLRMSQSPRCCNIVSRKTPDQIDEMVKIAEAIGSDEDSRDSYLSPAAQFGR